jgi:hypothetical protein
MMRRRARRAFLIRSGHAKQAQSHRTTGNAYNELCRVERSCRGPARARARRQGDHDPGARMDAALHPGPLSEGGRRAGGCVSLQHPPSFRADARKEAVTPWAAHRIGEAGIWRGFKPWPARAQPSVSVAPTPSHPIGRAIRIVTCLFPSSSTITRLRRSQRAGLPTICRRTLCQIFGPRAATRSAGASGAVSGIHGSYSLAGTKLPTLRESRNCTNAECGHNNGHHGNMPHGSLPDVLWH